MVKLILTLCNVMQMIDRGNTESAAVINCPRWLIRIHDFIRLANQVFYVWMLVLKYIFFLFQI